MKEENMREIRVLDSSTIDKIAAGEVVERPASVVKELVENAMDSHASAITVEIRDGGIGLIRVTDDGDGIEKSQVSKAFYRHATSKIQTAEDLTRVMSLGFRGEALSSICAVAQVEMITRTKDALTGIRYVIEGGTEKSSEEIGAPEGTTVIVRNLFFNVPARRKFLKTAQSEAGHVADLMEHLALSHPSVSFKLMINGQLKFHTTGNGDRREIVYRIYGRDIAGELVPIEREENGYHVNGLLGTPVIGRANRNFEHTFINGRYIKSAVIAKAAEDGYKPYLMQHKYPFFLLDIRMEPDMLDVNVHPAKMEVRFHQQMTVSDFIYRAVSDVLSGKEMIKEVKLSEKEDREAERVQRRELERVPVPEPFEKTARLLKESHEKEERLREEPLYQANPLPEIAPNLEKTSDIGKSAAAVGSIVSRIFGENPSNGDSVSRNTYGNVIKKDQHIFVEKPEQLNFFDEKILTKNAREEYRVLGQIFDTYWIVAFRDKVLFIDQHAAHEKIMYERLLHRLEEKQVTSQNLNPPVIVTLSGKDEAVYQQYRDYFASIGFEVEHFGGSEYAIRSVPTDLYGCDEKQLFEEILTEIADGQIKGAPDVVAQKLASMACKAAIKGNHSYSQAEAEKLIDELLELDNPYHCPHGRPTIISMSKYEMERKFNRIV